MLFQNPVETFLFLGFCFKYRTLLHPSPRKSPLFALCQWYPPPGVKLEGAVSHGCFHRCPWNVSLTQLHAALCRKQLGSSRISTLSLGCPSKGVTPQKVTGLKAISADGSDGHQDISLPTSNPRQSGRASLLTSWVLVVGTDIKASNSVHVGQRLFPLEIEKM